MTEQQIRENIKEYLIKIDDYNQQGYFQDTWESLSRYQVPNWYRGAKLGIFYHWGVYTVPQTQSEWYSRNMYIQGSKSHQFHLDNYGETKEFGYKELIPLFTGEKFDPKQWLSLAEDLNAKYMIPVAEHHDGFQMYDSVLSQFNSKLMGPKRDIIASLYEEAQKRNMKFGVSSHRAEHYWFMEGALDYDSGIENPQFGDLYWPTIKESDLNKDEATTKLFLEDWLVRCCELVDLFSPRVVYFDWWIEMPVFKPYLRKFLAYYYNKCIEVYGEHGIVNYKHDGIPYLMAVRDVERGQFASVQQDYWQCCTSSTRNSWSYTNANEYKTSTEVIQTFIDVISKNGNLLLNSGPKSDGTIDEEERKLFREIGDWVRAHNQAIEDTTVWKTFGEGDNNTSGGNFSEGTTIKYKKYDIRFTYKQNTIYAFIMNPTNETQFEIKSMGVSRSTLTHHAVIKNVTAISPGITINDYERNTNCLKINIDKHQENQPIVFAIEIE